MRLFLSSQDLGNYGERARQLAGKNNRVAYMKNAQDDLQANERNWSTPDKKKMFEAVGFEFEELDLRDYFGEEKKLQKKLSNFGSVFAAGGNTFILRRAMKISGFDVIVKQLLDEDRILYGGWSAGACVAAESLHGVEKGDRPQPDDVPKNYHIKETIWEGLELVDFMIVPHYKSTWFEKEADATIEYLKKHNLPYRIIKDGQVIVINGDKEEFLR